MSGFPGAEGTIVETDVVSLIETRRYEPAIQWTGFEHPLLRRIWRPSA